MNSLRNNLIILGLVVVLLGAAAYLIFLRQPVSEATQLGLDLEGGVRVQMEGFREDGGEVTTEEMERAVEVIRDRVDSLGVTEPEIRQQGADQALVDIPGLTDTEQAVEVIGRTAQLYFYEVVTIDQEQAAGPEEAEEVREELREDLRGDSDFEEGETQILFGEQRDPGIEGILVTGYIVSEEPDMTGEALNNAILTRDETGRLGVQMDLTNQGGQQFLDLSREISQNALASGQPDSGQLAIVLDEEVVSAPVVSQPISGGQVIIENRSNPQGLPQDEAEELEVVLQTGALPVNMEILSTQTIGPTLGADSLRSGLTAAAVGFGLVLLFLLFIYRALGVVAALALGIYAVLLWGLVVAIPVTMTLPGIAGIVLSIGVVVDANIVIFERVKEEVRKGKTPRTAVRLGYEKGFRAILDGNATTLITAFILFALASAQVRGFAVLLALGVGLSMLTAVVVTRALLGVVASRNFQLSPAMMGVSKKSIASAQREVK